MKRFNITCPRKYTKNNEEKTYWARVGTLVKFDATPEKPEGYIMELNMFPDTKFAVFEDKPREQNRSPQQTPQNPQKDWPDESQNEINPDDIPF